VRSLWNFAKKAAEALLQNSGEFLREDAQLLPRSWQVEDFIEEVQELRSDIERFEARLTLLQQRLSVPLSSEATEPTTKGL
jgi:ubiquinone biosynthesis protein UbiJ